MCNDVGLIASITGSCKPSGALSNVTADAGLLAVHPPPVQACIFRREIAMEEHKTIIKP